MIKEGDMFNIIHERLTDENYVMSGAYQCTGLLHDLQVTFVKYSEDGEDRLVSLDRCVVLED